MHFHVPPSLLHRRFRLLWLGLMISIAGTQMQIWAMLWQIRELTDQPIALGGIGLARILPVIIFSLIAGAVADVANRRNLLLLTQSLMAVLAFIFALLTFQGRITIGLIYLLAALQAVLVTFDLPARQSLVPNLVAGRDLPSAFSMMSIAFEVGAIAGPALSGLVIANWGLGSAYIINAISYGAVILALILMGQVPQAVNPNKRPEVNVVAVREGIKYIWSKPIILSTMLIDFFATFFSSANTLMPIIARDILHLGVVEYGWLSAAQSIGAASAALVISQVRDLKRQGLLFISAVFAFGFSTVLLGLSTTFVLAMAALILIGASDSVSTIIRNTIRQLQTPDYIRGRITSVNQIFFMGGPQLGEIEAGAVAQIFGVPFAIVSGGIGCILAIFGIIRKWPQLLAFNGDEPIAAGAPAD